MTHKFPFDQFLKWDSAKENPGKPTQQPTSQSVASVGSKPATKVAPSTQSGQELELLGHAIKETIRTQLGSSQYSAYFSDTFAVGSMGAQTIEFLVTTNFIKKVIESQYLDIVKSAVLETLGAEYEITFQTLGAKTSSLSSNTDSILKESLRRGSNARENTFVIPDLILTNEDKQKVASSRVMEQMEARPAHGIIDSLKKFNNFVVGSSNNLAHASALAVAREPGLIYPSLYIYGNSGLGKTHLIHAIANHVLEHRPHLKICITSCNNMMVELVEATKDNKTFDFRKKYTQGVDVLIIDDIHELSGKPGTQEQFFHIFNDLSNRKKQLIFTSDKTPRDINGIEERIRTRLGSALTVEIQQPDLETRIAILKTKAQEKDFFLSDEVVTLIAKCVKTSIRELEGCLLKLKAYFDIMQVDIDLELAKEHLKLTEQEDAQKIVTVDAITKAVARHFSIPLGDIRGKTKTKEIVLARQISMYLIHQHLRKTLLEIAHYFGKKDHTTPMYSLEVVKKRIKTDPVFAQQIVDIENSF